MLARILFVNAEFGMRIAESGWSAELMAPGTEMRTMDHRRWSIVGEPSEPQECRGGDEAKGKSRRRPRSPHGIRLTLHVCDMLSRRVRG